VDAGSLNFGAVPLGRGVVDGEDKRTVAGDGFLDDLQECGGERLGLASDRVEAVILGSEAFADAGGDPPSGDGATAVGQEDAQDDGGQSPGEAAVEWGGQSSDPGGPRVNEFEGEHPRPSSV
jgi:hypothetical protein